MPAISARSQTTPEPHLALLRGINVGGKNTLPMEALREVFAQTGCTKVSTYIQSGNVVFMAPTARLKNLSAELSSKIRSKFGFEVPIILRSASELHAACRQNPFLKAGMPEAALHLMCLKDAPTSTAVAQLDVNRSPGDAFVVKGRDIYLHCPSGLARTKLTNAYFDKALKTTSTVRNWRTVLKLGELLLAL
ncbi:MAG: DUF1697 domain-containing protein [Polyangiaceae bacterium]|nr:DUF1697 domain-containing protein [Polyangiaceae bacterium]